MPSVKTGAFSTTRVCFPHITDIVLQVHMRYCANSMILLLQVTIHNPTKLVLNTLKNLQTNMVHQELCNTLSLKLPFAICTDIPLNPKYDLHTHIGTKIEKRYSKYNKKLKMSRQSKLSNRKCSRRKRNVLRWSEKKR